MLSRPTLPFLTLAFLAVSTGPLFALISPIRSFPYRIKDAEFSTALNAIVSVSELPPQLHVYNPDTNTSVSVNLPLTPNCVSVSPDGLRAVVGHNAWISEVDLAARTLVKTISVAANVSDIVHGGNGYAYAYSGNYYLRSINLTSEAESQTYTQRNAAKMRLHPDRNRIYGADVNSSPDDIVRVDVGAGVAVTGRDSPYHGDYAMCSNVWISRDGARLITACGNTFRSSNDPRFDMLFSGKLSQVTRIRWAASDQNTIAVLPDYLGTLPRTDNEIHYYSHEHLLYRGKTTLPSFVTETSTWPGRGLWLFYNETGTKHYVVLQADSSSGIANDFGVVTIDCTSASVSLDLASQSIAAVAQTVSVGVTGVTSCGWKAESDAEWIDTLSSGVGNGTMILHVAANDSASERTGTVTIGNASFSLTQSASNTPGSLHVSKHLIRVPFRVVDAEYSKALDAIVSVSESPNRLHIYRPASDALHSIDLGAAPFSVSVGPEGKFAAVGHDRSISYVDLENAVLVKTLNVSTNILDIVLAGNGYVYAFPRTDQWTRIHSVHIASDTETLNTGYYLYAGTLARLHPGGTWMYGANNGLSPSDIEKYDISPGTASYMYQSAYHGEYPMCGNLWFSEDGGRIYTACGNVFRSTNVQATDMTYAGKLEQENDIRWVSHSQGAGWIAALPSFVSSWWGAPPRRDHEVHYYSPDFFSYRGTTILPSFMVETQAWQSRGRWHFFDAAGARQYIIVQSDPEAGMLRDFGVVTIDCTQATVSLGSPSASVGSSGGNLQTSVTATEGCGWKTVSNVSWINSLSSGVGNGTIYMVVSENLTTQHRSGTVTIGAATFTVQQAGAAPTSVIATATTATSVDITWSFTSAAHYEVWRVSPTENVRVGTPTTTSFTDTTATPDTAYVYKVRAVLNDGSMSTFVADYTHTYTYTDLSLVGAPIRAVHVMELRAIVNGARVAAGQTAVSFTDASLVGVTAKRVHITELHEAIDGLRSSMGRPAYGFSALSPNSTIMAITTEQIRSALR
jgi:hypothetical protein